jgi:hypothetical protein
VKPAARDMQDSEGPNMIVIAHQLGREAAKAGMPCDPPPAMNGLHVVAWNTGWREHHRMVAIEAKIRAKWFTNAEGRA